QSAVGLWIDCNFQHRHFILAGRLQPVDPVLSDVDVTGCAGKAATAVGRDAPDTILLGCAHHGLTVRGIHDHFTLVMLNKTNFSHKSSCKPGSTPRQLPSARHTSRREVPLSLLRPLQSCLGMPATSNADFRWPSLTQ